MPWQPRREANAGARSGSGVISEGAWPISYPALHLESYFKLHVWQSRQVEDHLGLYIRLPDLFCPIDQY
jgi:hypothetical protein